MILSLIKYAGTMIIYNGQSTAQTLEPNSRHLRAAPGGRTSGTYGQPLEEELWHVDGADVAVAVARLVEAVQAAEAGAAGAAVAALAARHTRRLEALARQPLPLPLLLLPLAQHLLAAAARALAVPVLRQVRLVRGAAVEVRVVMVLVVVLAGRRRLQAVHVVARLKHSIRAHMYIFTFTCTCTPYTLKADAVHTARHNVNVQGLLTSDNVRMYSNGEANCNRQLQKRLSHSGYHELFIYHSKNVLLAPGIATACQCTQRHWCLCKLRSGAKR